MRIGVIGAGPAGSMAACTLGRAGADVTLFDPSHPREKPCGGGVTGRALALVAGIVNLETLPSVVVSHAWVGSAEHEAEIPLGTGAAIASTALAVFSRRVFDEALLKAAIEAGASHRAHLVTALRRDGAHLEIQTAERTYRVDHVIGADGTGSLVRRTFAAPFRRSELSVAAGFYAWGAASSRIHIQTMTEQPGYLWSFPRADHLAVGVCASASTRTTAGALKRQAAAWLARRFPDARLHLEPYAWPIPTLADDRTPPLGGPGWMLAGDAAGLVDPLTREGIYYALLSGVWAAEALLSSPSDRAASQYAARVRDEVCPELARAARLSGPFFTPEFGSLLVQALGTSEPIRKVFVDLVTGSQPYRGLKRRLIGTSEWALAGRAIRLLFRPRLLVQ